MPPLVRRKKDPSLQYRWGIIGMILAIAGFAWFMRTGVMTNTLDNQDNPNVKIVCPRCAGDPARQPNCSLCRGTGFLWVDKTKYLPGEISTIPAEGTAPAP